MKCSISLLLLLTLPSSAVIVGLDAIDAGFFNAAGRSSKNDGIVLGATPATFNYSAGAIDEAPPLAGSDVPRRNYFTFDLSGVTPGTITAAGMSLFMPADGYTSPDLTETYALSAVAAGTPPGMATFASDLEMVYSIFDGGELAAAAGIFTGLAVPAPPLAVVSLSEADEGTFVTMMFTPDGIAYLNAFAGGPVVIGGEVVTLDAVDAGDEVVFGFTSPYIPGVADPLPPYATTPTPSLAIDVVPEPSTALLVSLCALFGFIRKRSDASNK